ncbi:NTPase KAP [Parashewanella curva]|uniref:NTPase KAP n=1 Tax=Parashewanella curva TaxID=2338552 RepID=A0A3L8PZF3_9GAMM|nr:P-loop NTPase fold protein [Parashewanella curva]RLV59908.1 NTPase KAP [Parashewanella curva]
MANQGCFVWDQSIEFELEEPREVLPQDALDRSKYAEFIANFLAAEGYNSETDKKRNYVLNLNAEWGAGKTYFIKRFYQSLKGVHPVVYIDAWKQDYSDDPLLTVVSSMICQLKEQAGVSDGSVSKASKNIFEIGKSAAPALVGALTKRYVGIDIRELFDNEQDVESEDESQTSKSADYGNVAKDLTNALLKEHQTKAQAIRNLKTDVKEWIGAVVGIKQIQYPAFILIDELDRCRPSYAVEMLEVIKHIFDIEGIVFVIATDTDQLQHTVKSVYGSGFDASRYLGRFFHSRFMLKQAELEKLLPLHCNIDLLDSGSLKESRNITLWPLNSPENHTKNLTGIFYAFNIPARTAIQIINRITAIVSNLRDGAKLDLLMLTTLFCIRELDESLYPELVRKYVASRLEGQHITNYLYKNYHIAFSDFYVNYEFEGSFHPSGLGASYSVDQCIEQGLYHTGLESCISSIFLNIFNCGTRGGAIAMSVHNKKSELVHAAEAVMNSREGMPSVNPSTFNSELLKYTYFDSELEQVSSSTYTDLVELAVNLSE